MDDELLNLKNEVSELRTKLDTLDTHLDLEVERLESRVSSKRCDLRSELSTRIQAEAEAADTVRTKLANSTSDRIGAVAYKTTEEIKALGVRLTTANVDLSVQLRKVIDALDNKITAELAALAERLDEPETAS